MDNFPSSIEAVNHKKIIVIQNYKGRKITKIYLY